MFPVHRPRRLRRTAQLRDLVAETRLWPGHLIWPLFVQEKPGEPEPIASMPGQLRHNIDSLLKACDRAVEAGLRAVLLFGIPLSKDEAATQAWSDDGIVQRAVRAIKDRRFPLTVITDVCLCEYTSHGHCGVIRDGDVDNDSTLELLVRTAVSQARAGADIVAPSDMMDGRVWAIRRGLDQAGLVDKAILAYSAKYASAFYGPFREAAGSAPQFGDRRSYQMDPPNVREARREVRADLEEGADMIMVKPALAYLDVIRAVREICDLPLVAYNVSGEYAMVEFASRAGALDRRRAILEILTSIKRAGADLIITYHAPEVVGWL
jgi:porphobilinogen synthase